MSKFFSLLLGFIGATMIYWGFLRSEPYTSPNGFTHIAADLIGRQAAIMTDPIFWFCTFIAYAVIRFVVSAQAGGADAQ
ncbi:MAG: hypothetical protein DHS20C08_04710 [Rhodomicrobium sp.]|nr:MAG: hypothetical protein DHS20C08_04710 [Rhodomicrobium sp.]